jgi:hypothetical protein
MPAARQFPRERLVRLAAPAALWYRASGVRRAFRFGHTVPCHEQPAAILAARRTPLAAAALHGVGLGALPARADQDDDAERVPSSAGDVYSPIERTFQRQQLLPGGPVARLPQFGPAVPKPEGPVLLQDLKERLRYDDPFFRDMKVDLYLRTGYLDRHNSDGSVSQAWAGGSALGFRSGWHDD